MCQLFYITLLLIASVSVPGKAAPAEAATKETKRVLLLFSLDKGHPGHILTDKGIVEVLRVNKAFDAQIFAEYLDMNRFPDPAQTRSVADFLRQKYAHLKVDAIITLYPSAVDFLRNQRPTLFPDVPIVAGEVTRSYAGSLDLVPARRRITGTILGDNAAGVLEAALRAKPIVFYCGADGPDRRPGYATAAEKDCRVGPAKSGR